MPCAWQSPRVHGARNARSASRAASGCSTIIMCPHVRQDDQLRAFDGLGKAGGVAGRGHAIGGAGDHQGRTAHPGRGPRPVPIVVAGREIGVQARPGGLGEQAERVPEHPAAGRLVAAEVPGGAEPPVADQRRRQRLGPRRRREQRGVHRHPRAAPSRARRAIRLRLPRRELEADQRPHGMPDQVHRRHAERFDQRTQPVGHGGDRAQRLAGAAAVARQIHGQRVPAAIGEMAGLHGPDRVVHAGAVHEQNRRPRRIEPLAVIGKEHPRALEPQLHRRLLSPAASPAGRGRGPP